MLSIRVVDQSFDLRILTVLNLKKSQLLIFARERMVMIYLGDIPTHVIEHIFKVPWTVLEPLASTDSADMLKEICIKLGFGTQTLDPLFLLLGDIFGDGRILEPFQRDFCIVIVVDP